MTFLKKTFLLATASILFLTSCKHALNLNDSLTAIPKDAVSVTAINVQNLMQKADFEAVKNMDFYKKAIEEAQAKNPAIAEILKDPKKSGIDLSKNFYIVAGGSVMGVGQGDGNDAGILLSIADIKAFETMVQNGNKTGKIETKDGVKCLKMNEEVEENNGDGYTISSHKNGLLAWNDKMAFLGSNVIARNEATEGANFMQYFKTKPEESIAKNEQLQTLMASSHDIYSFVSFDKYADNMSAKAAAGAMNLDSKALKGNYFSGFSDFEKGKIVGKSDFIINKAITKDWGLLFKSYVKTDFSKYLNGQNLGFAMTLGLDTKGLKEILNSNAQFNAAMQMGGSAYGFTVDDVLKAFDGDVVIAASPNNGAGEKWSGMMGFRINDKNKLMKFLEAMVKEQILVKESDNAYHFSEGASGISRTYVKGQGKMVIKDDVLFAGDDVTINSLNTNGSVNSDVKDVLNKNIFGVYANFVKIFANDAKMQDPEFTEMKMTVNSKTGESTIKMKNEHENSLKTLMQALNKWYLKNKAENEENKVKLPQSDTRTI
jgi:Domain of unknown function (DUF4836)